MARRTTAPGAPPAHALVFARASEIVRAIGNGDVPADQPVQVARGQAGEIVVVPARAMTAARLKRLATAYAVTVSAPPSQATPLPTWYHAVPVQYVGSAATGPTLLIGERGAILHTASDLLRFGSSASMWCLRDDGPSMLLANSPSSYVTTSAAAGRAVRVYTSAGPKVWVEAGHRHPYAARAAPRADALLLIDREGWRELPDGPWSSPEEAVSLRTAPQPEAEAGRIDAPLRLYHAPAARGAGRGAGRSVEHRIQASDGVRLIVIDGADAQDRLVRFLSTTGDSAYAGWTATQTGGGYVLRSTLPMLVPAGLGVGYGAVRDLPGFHVPAGARLLPDLHRDLLRQKLELAPERVYWLEEGPVGPWGYADAVALQSLAATDFEPLEAHFDFQPGEGVRSPWPEPVEEPLEVTGPGPERDERTARPPPAPGAPEPAPAAAPAPAPRSQRRRRAPVPPKPRPAAPAPTTSAEIAEVQARLTATEQAYTASPLPVDHPDRTTMWATLGDLSARMGRIDDAGLAWSRAAWADPSYLDPSAEAQVRLLGVPWGAPADVLAALTSAAPTRDHVRAVAGVAAAAAARGALPERVRLDAAAWWRRHAVFAPRAGAHADAQAGAIHVNCDVRSFWLGTTALLEGDAVGIASALDAIGDALRFRLPLVDVPTFLRRGPGSAGRGSAVAQTGLLESAHEQLDAMLVELSQRSGVEPLNAVSWQNARAYLPLLFACGHARLGDHRRAAALLVRGEEMPIHAHGRTDPTDDPRRCVVAAYTERARAALAGLQPETALSPEVQQCFGSLPNAARTFTSVLRATSLLLDDSPVPARPFGMIYVSLDPLGEEFVPVRRLSGADLAQKLIELLDADGDTETRSRIVEGVTTFLPALTTGASEVLRRVARACRTLLPAYRIFAASGAMALLAMRGELRQVEELAALVISSLPEVTRADARRVGASIAGCLRGLSRAGLRSLAIRLIEVGLATLTALPRNVTARSDYAAILYIDAARLRLAGGYAAFGMPDKAQPYLDAARRVLHDQDPETEKATPGQIAPLVRAYCQAHAHTTPETAAAAVVDLLLVAPRTRRDGSRYGLLSDSVHALYPKFASILALGFADSLILALSDAELALPIFTRTWMDEDEYLIRRRVSVDRARIGV